MSTTIQELPEPYRYYSLDEVAECVAGLTPETRNDLWEQVAKAEQAGTAKPPGGDGSNGTFEEPVITDGEYGTDLVAGWPHLQESSREDIITAAKNEPE